MHRRGRSFALVTTLVMLATLLTVGPVTANSAFTVTTTDDVTDAAPGDGACDDGAGRCSLRAAVVEGNAAGGEVAISLPAGEYALSSEVQLSASVSLTGAGADATWVQNVPAYGDELLGVLAGASLAVTDVGFRDVNADPRATMIAVHGQDASVLLDHVDVRSAGAGVAQWYDAGHRVRIEIVDSTFADVEYPIFFVDGRDQMLDVRRTTFLRPGYSAVFVATHGGHFTVADSVIESGPEAGGALEFYGESEVDGGGDPATFEFIRTEMIGGGVDEGAIYASYGFDAAGQPQFELRVIDSTIADWSYGIVSDGHLTIEDSTLRNNASFGVDHVQGDVRIAGSTFDANGGYAAGLWKREPQGTATVTNSTFSGNTDSALWIEKDTGTVRNVTITGTWQEEDEGIDGGLVVSGTAVEVENTVVAGNYLDCRAGGTQLSLGQNLDSDGSCGFGQPSDRSGVDALLGPLADNGGPTWTHAPLSGSPLIDTGGGDCPATDQRGAPRPADGTGDGTAVCDIGALEVGAEPGAGELAVTWEGDSARRGLLRGDGGIDVEVTGPPGAGTATARADVTSWHPGGDPTAPALADPAATVLTIDLTETAAGRYTGTFPLDGVVEISRITGAVDPGDGVLTGETTERLPVRVAGTLELLTDLDVPAWALPSVRVQLTSLSSRDGDTVSVPFEGTTSTRWLLPATDYTVRLLDADNQVVAELTDPVTVRGGLITPVDLTLAPSPYVPFTITALDANGHPLAGVKLTVTDVRTGDQVAKATTAADGSVSGVARGDAIHLSLDPLLEPYAPLDHDITLTELGEHIQLTLGATLPTAIVTGIVDHPDRPPVPGARVSLTTRIGDRAFSTTTVSDETGAYRAVVLQGQVTVEVDEPRAGRAETTAEVTGDTVIDVMLDGPALGTLEIELYTQVAGEPTPTRVAMTGANAWHYHVYVRPGVGRSTIRPTRDVIDLPVRVGTPIRVCADGREGQLPAACVETTVDPATLHATARLDLVQAGRIEGVLAWDTPNHLETQTYRADRYARLFRVDGDRRTLLRSGRVPFLVEPESGQEASAAFELGIDDPGTYEVDLRVEHFIRQPDNCSGPGFCPAPQFEWTGSDSAWVRVEVADGQVHDLGTVPLSRCTRHGGGCVPQFSTGSPLTATSMAPSTVVPGEVVRLRASAHNTTIVGEAPPAENARLRLVIPPGTTLLPDSVLLDGEPAVHTEVDGVLEVAVGTIAPDGHHVLSAWVSTTADLDVDALWTQGTIVYGADDTEELLGTGVAVVHRLSMTGPATTSEASVAVSGRAVPDSDVEVSVNGAPAATATATRGGHWSATVRLPTTPMPTTFQLQATADTAHGTITAIPTRVTFDPDVPSLELVTMSQAGGNPVTIDPAQGIARFPYVWVPSRSVDIDLTFSRPELVQDPVVTLGTTTSLAELDPATGRWRASLRPRGQQLGKIFVSWSNGAAHVDLAPADQPDPLTAEQIRTLLPPPFNTFTDVVVEDGTDADAIRVTGALPDLGDDATFEIDITGHADEYTPTDEDLATAAGSGVEMYDTRVDVVETADEVVIDATAFIPDSALASGSGVIPAGSSTPPPPAGDATFLAAAQSSAVGGARIAFRFAFKATDAGDNIWGALGSGGPHQQLADLRNDAAGCSADRMILYHDRAERIARDLLAFEVIKFGFGIAAGTLAPATFGLGTLAVWFVGYAYGKAVDHKNGARIEQLRKDIQNDPDCAEPAPPPPTPEDDCDEQIWFDACEVLADPVWIHDPSGYVYELFDDTRIEGVTATLETAETATGPWEIWDAEWFGQSNPMLTDDEGRYGWDVPTGWWRVRWDADGYATAYSEALEVLPPHFDVNMGLERLAGPALEGVEAAEDDPAITVTFDGWMLASWLDDTTVTVTDAGGDPVPATVAPVEVRSAPGVGDVVRALTLDIGDPLVAGASYTVTVDRVARTYAEVPGDDDLTIEVTVADGGGVDPSPPPSPPPSPSQTGADVQVTKTAGQPSAKVGELVPFTVTVENAGPDRATGVVMTDPLPDTVSFVAVSEGSCVYDTGSHRLRAPLGELASGASRTCRYEVLLDREGTVENTAAVASTTLDPTAANDRATSTVTVAGRPSIAQRLYGSSRIDTAVAASKAIYGNGEAGAVVLARADLFPDALTGTPLAATLRAPLLLTDSSQLVESVEREIRRVLPSGGTVHLLGGHAALSPSVDARLEELGYRVRRYAGTTRFETATLIAAAVPAPKAVFLATGDEFADALAAGAAAASQGAVILLTDRDERADATETFLQGLGDVPRYAVGGPATRAYPEAVPLTGRTRVETAVAVAERFFPAPTAIGIATAQRFPDAVSGGTHVGRHLGPILLTDADVLPDAVARYLGDRRATTEVVYIYGGPGAVTDAVIEAIEAVG